MDVSPMLPEHADAVLTIYRAGIDGGDATFETAAPTWPKHRLAGRDRVIAICVLRRHRPVGLADVGRTAVPDMRKPGSVAGLLDT